MVEDAQFHASVTPHPLQLNRYTDWVADPGAGAIASFTGVTRDNFEGQRTARLEYEAYTPMAVAKLRDLCAGAAARWQIIRMAVAHRIGEVGVGQPSVIIAVSSAHRREALEVGGWVSNLHLGMIHNGAPWLADLLASPSCVASSPQLCHVALHSTEPLTSLLRRAGLPLGHR